MMYFWIYLYCDDCDFRTDNLNGYDDIEGYREETEIVVEQVIRSIRGT